MDKKTKKFIIEKLDEIAVDNCCDTKFGLTDVTKNCPLESKCRMYEDPNKYACLLIKELKRSCN